MKKIDPCSTWNIRNIKRKRKIIIEVSHETIKNKIEFKINKYYVPRETLNENIIFKEKNIMLTKSRSNVRINLKI